MAEVCSSCGASDPDGTSACSLCHRVREVHGLAGDPGVGPNGFLAAPPRATLRLDEREFSRTRAGSMSFGLRGRLVISVLCLVPCAGAFFLMGGTESLGSVAGIVTMAITMVPMLLLPGFFVRDAWRSHRVR
jgi:hypothetical protein